MTFRVPWPGGTFPLPGARPAPCLTRAATPLPEDVVLPSSDPFLAEVLGRGGGIDLVRLLHALQTTRTGLASSCGLPLKAISGASGIRSRSTQARLREVAELIGRVLTWAGSAPRAFAWYRAQPRPAFGDRTAEDLVREGRAEAVMAHLERVAFGGYA